jgi:hypothetical protein
MPRTLHQEVKPLMNSSKARKYSNSTPKKLTKPLLKWDHFHSLAEILEALQVQRFRGMSPFASYPGDMVDGDVGNG